METKLRTGTGLSTCTFAFFAALSSWTLNTTRTHVVFIKSIYLISFHAANVYFQQVILVTKLSEQCSVSSSGFEKKLNPLKVW